MTPPTRAVLAGVLLTITLASGTVAAPRAANHAEAVGAPVGWQPGVPSSPGAPSPTAPPVDQAATADLVPVDDPEGPKATMPAGLVGTASWYRYLPGQAAAGPRLRAMLGPGWRGMTVTVRGIPVRLTDWCRCMEGQPDERLIDLDSRTFARLAPLSLGLVEVWVA